MRVARSGTIDVARCLAVASATLAACAVCNCSPSPRFAVAPMMATVEPPIDAGVVPEPSAPEPRVGKASLLGRWTGVGQQSDGTSWLMVVDITSGSAGPCATVRYPSVGCSGAWMCTTDSDGTTMNALERITEGRSACVDGGSMRMYVGQDRALEWSWSGPSSETAHARLRRAP